MVLSSMPANASEASKYCGAVIEAAQEIVIELRRAGVSAHQADVAMQNMFEESNATQDTRTIMEMAYSYAYGPNMAELIGWGQVKDMWYMSCKRRAPLYGWSE